MQETIYMSVFYVGYLPSPAGFGVSSEPFSFCPCNVCSGTRRESRVASGLSSRPAVLSSGRPAWDSHCNTFCKRYIDGAEFSGWYDVVGWLAFRVVGWLG